MKRANYLADQKGVALVVALVMLLLLTFIGLAAVCMTSYEAKISGNERVYNNAFYAGDGGIENFRARASTGEFFHTVADKGSYQVNIGDCVSNVSYRRGLPVSTSGFGAGTFQTVDFVVRSEGVSPSFPVAGRVVIEAILEVNLMNQEGYN